MEIIIEPGTPNEEKLKGELITKEAVDRRITRHASDTKETTEINRVEVIDHTKSVEDGGGRRFVYWDTVNESKINILFQDSGRTVKLFIEPKVPFTCDQNYGDNAPKEK